MKNITLLLTALLFSTFSFAADIDYGDIEDGLSGKIGFSLDLAKEAPSSAVVVFNIIDTKKLIIIKILDSKVDDVEVTDSGAAGLKVTTKLSLSESNFHQLVKGSTSMEMLFLMDQMKASGPLNYAFALSDFLTK